jgi:hypothetical protein
MSKNESKKNVEKLKVFLAKQEKKNDIKPSNKKAQGDSTCTQAN